MAFKNVKKIALWEARQVLRSKVFIISILAVPLILRLFLVTENDPVPYKSITCVIGILDESGICGSSFFKNHLPMSESPGYNFIFIKLQKPDVPIERNLSAAGENLLARRIDAYIHIPADMENIQFCSNHVMPDELLNELKSTFSRLIARNNEPDVTRLIKGISKMSTLLFWNNNLIAKGELDRRALGALVMITLLFASLGLTGNWFLRAFVEEKNNRLLEVLLSSCSSSEILWGKFTGLLFIAFLQLLTMGVIFIISSLGNLDKSILIIAPGWALLLFTSSILMFLSLYLFLGIISKSEVIAQSIGMLIGLFVILPAGFVAGHFYSNNQVLLNSLLYVPVFTPGAGFVLIQDGTLGASGMLGLVGAQICLFLIVMSLSVKVFVVQIAQPVSKDTNSK